MPRHWVTDVSGQCVGPSFKGQENQIEFVDCRGHLCCNFYYLRHILESGRPDWSMWRALPGSGATLELCLFSWVWQGCVRVAEECTIQRSRPMCLWNMGAYIYHKTRRHNPDALNLNLHGFQNTKSFVAYSLSSDLKDSHLVCISHLLSLCFVFRHHYK